jgi:hypothetical protein
LGFLGFLGFFSERDEAFRDFVEDTQAGGSDCTDESSSEEDEREDR